MRKGKFYRTKINSEQKLTSKSHNENEIGKRNDCKVVTQTENRKKKCQKN